MYSGSRQFYFANPDCAFSDTNAGQTNSDRFSGSDTHTKSESKRGQANANSAGSNGNASAKTNAGCREQRRSPV